MTLYMLLRERGEISGEEKAAGEPFHQRAEDVFPYEEGGGEA